MVWACAAAVQASKAAAASSFLLCISDLCYRCVYLLVVHYERALALTYANRVPNRSNLVKLQVNATKRYGAVQWVSKRMAVVVDKLMHFVWMLFAAALRWCLSYINAAGHVGRHSGAMFELLSLDNYATTAAPAGAMVRQRNQALSDVLYLESGTVAFGVQEDGRFRHFLGVLQAPCWLDAAPALAGQPCAVDMLAQTPVQWRAVPVEALRSNLAHWPQAAQGLVHSMAQGYCQQAALTVSRVAQDAVARCAQWLLQHAQQADGALTVQLAQSKRQIAATLGIAPETLSRILRQLRDQGMLEGLGKTLKLPQPDSLRQLAKA